MQFPSVDQTTVQASPNQGGTEWESLRSLRALADCCSAKLFGLDVMICSFSRLVSEMFLFLFSVEFLCRGW